MTISTQHPAISPVLPPSHEVIRNALSEIGVKYAAQRLGVSPALVYKWTEATPTSSDPDGSGARNPLERVAEITRLTGDTLLIEWLCAVAGGTFVRDTSPARLPGELHSVTGRCGVVLIHTLQTLADAAVDGVICQREAPVIRAAWQTAKGETEGVVRAGEAGMFR